MGSIPNPASGQEQSLPLEEVDIAIIGGGPTGLFAGLLLDRLGISIVVVDAKPSSLDFGRADALNARTQQYFEVVNLLDDLLPQGLKCNTSSTFSDGEFKSRQSHWWTSLEHVLHKNFLMISQPVIEALLSSHISDKVRYGERVVSISEDDTSVHITTDKGRRITSRYVVGADGARSMVRNSLGISFTGTKPEMVWAVLDAFIETDFPQCPEIITFELNGQSRVSWIPRERGLSRFYVMLDGEVTLPRAQESLREHLAPYTIKFREVEWFSTFDVKERIASNFVSKGGKGRVFLAGDAAHVHSVNGGQGLNTGISDAFALAWRIAMVLTHKKKFQADQIRELLLSYDTERRTTAEMVINVAAVLVRATAHEAKGYVSAIERRAGYITGMGVSYRDVSSPLVWPSQHGIWRAGDRCPDLPLLLPSGEKQWLYSTVTYGKYLVLSLGRHLEIGAEYHDIAAAYTILAATASAADEEVETSEIENSSSRKGVSVSAFEAKWLAPNDKAVVVVRPDMHIGYVTDDTNSWVDYFQGILSGTA